MKIVHWGKYYAPDKGGIESVTSSLAIGAAFANHETTVVCFGRTFRRSVEIQSGVSIIRCPIRLLKASQPLGWDYVQSAISSARGADLVHLHAPNMLAALVSIVLPKNIQLVVHWHSDVVGKGFVAKLLGPVEQVQLRRANAIICTSDAYAKASVTLRAWRDKVTVIPIGVPSPSPMSFDRGDLPPLLMDFIGSRKLILSVGRLVPYKGFEVLIEAASSISADCAIVVVGTGPLRESLAEQIRARGLENKVLLAGRQEDNILAGLFSMARLFCLPSIERSEAFGVVLVEAMAYGLPIVATDIIGSGVPWVNAHLVSGLNVRPGDATALAASCNRILSSDELHAALSMGSRHRFENEFTDTLAVERTLSLYNRLVLRK